MKLIHWITILIFSFSNFFLHAEDWKCSTLSLQEQVDQADIIFSGTCLFVNSNWISGGQKYVFQVEQTWKRRIDSLYIVNSKWEIDGGYIFEKGEKYLVYVDKGFTPKTNQCMGNKRLNEAEADLRLLGDGQSPSTSALYGPMVWTISLLGLFSFLFLGFIIFANKKNRK